MLGAANRFSDAACGIETVAANWTIGNEEDRFMQRRPLRAMSRPDQWCRNGKGRRGERRTRRRRRRVN
jgi:hypothetical protein